MNQSLFKFLVPAAYLLAVASTVLFSTKSSLSSSKKIRLVYFDAKGVVEMTRIMLKIGGLEFDDARFSINVKEGGGFETPEFAISKTAGELMANMDRAPVLQVGDVSIGQSKAIERYVAKKCNMMGNGDEVSSPIRGLQLFPLFPYLNVSTSMSNDLISCHYTMSLIPQEFAVIDCIAEHTRGKASILSSTCLLSNIVA
jgi:Glutathione S-transferase, N-terminal domain